jgi:hypothetical protein
MNLRPFQKDLLMNSVGNTQLQSAVDTVAKYGLMEASRYLKVPHSTLSSRLEKARMKGIIANGQSLTDEQALSAGEGEAVHYGTEGSPGSTACLDDIGLQG